MAKIEKALMDEYVSRELSRGFRGDSWVKYFTGKAGWLVTLTDGTIFCIEKPRIETEFCFGESGYDFDEAVSEACEARTNEKLFKVRNLRKIDETIKLLKEGSSCCWKDKLAVWIDHGVADLVREVNVEDLKYTSGDGKYLELDDANRDLLIKGYEIIREAFEKRIDTYLKRYGLTKVHSWTYWRDA